MKPPVTADAARRRARRTRRAGAGAPLSRRRARRDRGGYALLLSLIAIMILSVLVSDLHETSAMGLSASVAQRDQLRAEMLARSGMNLTRMLIVQERALRQLAEVPFRALFKRRPPQIPVWNFANMILTPFSSFETAQSTLSSSGFDVSGASGLGDTGGTFEVIGVSENSKLNISEPLYTNPNEQKAHVARQLYSLIGGYQPSPNKLDPLFSGLDENGRLTTRKDVVEAVIDWWDADENQTSFDPTLVEVRDAGGENTDWYQRYDDPYPIKNAPFDSIEELRMVRGFTDDFWATFVEPDPEDPRSRQITIYGGGKVNPNDGEPQVLLARLCSFPAITTQLLCADPTEQLKFVTLLLMARQIAPVPWFSRSNDFIAFVTGDANGLYGKLQGFMANSPLGESMLFTPIALPDDKDLLRGLQGAFVTSARIISLYVVGRVGNAEKRIHAVTNTDPRWIPPPPNTGKLPPLGIFHYYRID